jgi:Zn-finger nucleic acid-binding protein
VWLDRGELDKIVERASTERYDGAPRRAEPRRELDDSGEHRYDRNHGGRRKKGFFGELFDFD